MSQSHIKHEDYPDGVCRIIKCSQLHKDLLKANPDIKPLLTDLGCTPNQQFLLPFYSKYHFLFIKTTARTTVQPHSSHACLLVL